MGVDVADDVISAPVVKRVNAGAAGAAPAADGVAAIGEAGTAFGAFVRRGQAPAR